MPSVSVRAFDVSRSNSLKALLLSRLRFCEKPRKDRSPRDRANWSHITRVSACGTFSGRSGPCSISVVNGMEATAVKI